MGSPLRSLGLLFAVVIAMSIAQVPNDVTATVALFWLLVVTLLIAVSGGRPVRATTAGRRSTKARRPGYLARYDLFTEALVPTAMLTGVAFSEASHIVRGLSIATVAISAAILAFFFFFVSVRLGAAIAGLAGCLGVLFSFFFSSSPCRDQVSSAGLIIFSAVVVAGVVSAGLFRIPVRVPAWLSPARVIDTLRLRTLPRRRPAGTWMLALFGLVELAVFSAQPAGMDIWSSAPAGAVWAFGLLLAVVAFLGHYAPELVISLCALGLLIATVYLATLELVSTVGACIPAGHFFVVTIAAAVGAAGGQLLSLNP